VTRFYDLTDNTELGSTFLDSCAVVATRFLVNGLNLLAGNIKGDVYMLRIESHKSLQVQIAKIVEGLDRIWDLKVACFDSMSTWGMVCQGRIYKFWKRKDIYRVMNDQDEDLKMRDIRDLEYYLIDTYNVSLTVKEVDLLNSQEKCSYLEFSSIEPHVALIFTDNSLEVSFRNYKEHVVAACN
jgi:hypothetical protein